MTIDGATYAVRHTATAAEAVRLGRDRSPRRGAAVTKGALAILKASGCAIRRNSLRGDAALVVAELDCGGDAPPASASGAGLDCGFIPGIFDRDDWRGASIDCVVIPE